MFKRSLETLASAIKMWVNDKFTHSHKEISNQIQEVVENLSFEVPVTSVNGMTGDVVIELDPGVKSWNELTDRPFYEEGTGAVIEWDGNTDLSNADTVEIHGHTFYKISDHTPTIDDLANCELSGDMGEGMVTAPSEMVAMFFNVSPIDSNLIWGGDGFAIFHETTVQAYKDEFLTVPSIGIYICPDQFFPFRISYGSTIIKTLDEKFIPDTIARVSDIPQGGVTSWNDLANKPFNENGIGDIIEWDGSRKHRVVVEQPVSTPGFPGNEITYWVKLSDNAPEKELFLNGSMTLSDGEKWDLSNYEEFGEPDDKAYHVDYSNGENVFNGSYYLVTSCHFIIVKDIDTAIEIDFPSPGIYCSYTNDWYPTLIHYGDYTLKTLDEKFLPKVAKASVNKVHPDASGNIDLDLDDFSAIDSYINEVLVQSATCRFGTSNSCGTDNRFPEVMTDKQLLVVWDGVRYICDVFYQGNYFYFGNYSLCGEIKGLPEGDDKYPFGAEFYNSPGSNLTCRWFIAEDDPNRYPSYDLYLMKKTYQAKNISLQSDWECSNEADFAYIRNKPFGSFFNATSMILNVNSATAYMSERDLHYMQKKLPDWFNAFDSSIIEGEQYRIWRYQIGNKYAIAKRLSSSSLYLGNLNLVSSEYEDTGEDFLITVSLYESSPSLNGIVYYSKKELLVNPNSYENFAIIGPAYEIKQLPSKYLPLTSIIKNWSQNDKTAPDYIEGRTHYSDIEEFIAWNGDTQNLETSVEVDGVTYYLISESVPFSNEEIKASSVKIMQYGEELTIELKDIWNELVGTGVINDSYVITPYIIYIRNDETQVSDYVFPKAGIYFANYEGLLYTTNLFTEVVNKLDPKYLHLHFSEFTMVSPDGKAFTITINNNGEFVATPVDV